MARDQAVIHVEGLTLLRPELSANTVLLSRADAWNQVEPLFCGQVGPDREVCADALGYATRPARPGVDRRVGGHS